MGGFSMVSSREMDSPSTPRINAPAVLDRIIQRERELEMTILEARAQADAVIATAREQAGALAASKNAAAEIEADAIKKSLLDQARAEASRIRRANDTRLASIERIPPAKIEAVGRHLLDMVLPPTTSGGGAT
jgi:vacuolar-type H+-ATPase subunit H